MADHNFIGMWGCVVSSNVWFAAGNGVAGLAYTAVERFDRSFGSTAAAGVVGTSANQPKGGA